MMGMLPSLLYTVAASGGSPTPEELALPDPAEAERVIAENVLPTAPFFDPVIVDPDLLLFHAPIKAD